MSVDNVVHAYVNERDSVRKERIKTAYHALTGADIEDRVWILQD